MSAATTADWTERRASVLRSLRAASIKPIPYAPGFWVGWQVLCKRNQRRLNMVSDITQLRVRAANPISCRHTP